MLRRLLGLARLEAHVRDLAREVRDVLRDQAELDEDLRVDQDALAERLQSEGAYLRGQIVLLEERYKALEADNADLSITCAELQLRVLGLEHGSPNLISAEPTCATTGASVEVKP